MSLTLVKQICDEHVGIFHAWVGREPHTEPEIIDRIKKFGHSLASALTCFLDTGTLQPPPLYLSDVYEKEVLDDIFPYLRYDKQRPVWGLQEEQENGIPEHLTLIYRDFDLVYQLFGCPPDSQAVRRTRLSNILACCVAAELREMGYSDSDRPHQESSVPLTLQYEKYLKYKVKYKRQARLLQGYCDYSLWYGYGSGSDEEVHDLGLNLIVFEQRYASTGMAPCLAYMAMVHDIRKRAGKPDSTVYGLSTDSAWFFFQRIDNQGRVSMHLLHWFSQADKVYSVLRMIVRHCAQLSRDTSTTALPAARGAASLPERLRFSVRDRKEEEEIFASDVAED